MVIGGLVSMIAIAIVYFYYQIYKKVKESKDNLNANGEQNGIGVHTYHRTDVKLLKTCFIVVCFFFMTWGPASMVVVIRW